METPTSTTGFPGLLRVLLPAVLLTAGGAAGAAGPTSQQPVSYEVTRVDGKLVRVSAGEGEERVAAGARLGGGAELRTGWFSSADLAASPAAARFHLRSRTRVRLGSRSAGVLLILEKGRLRALFDALTGDAERDRRIETPSAVLAVRGTEYGVAVHRDGATTLVVFEGVVEVFGREGPPGPVRVGAGQALHLRRGQPPGRPHPHGLSRRGWDRGGMPAMGPPAGGPGRHGPPAAGTGGHRPPPPAP